MQFSLVYLSLALFTAGIDGIDFQLAAEKMECAGKDLKQGSYLSLAECATECRGFSDMFKFGRSDSEHCEDGKCHCYCEYTADKDGCQIKENVGFDLYQFTTKTKPKHNNLKTYTLLAAKAECSGEEKNMGYLKGIEKCAVACEGKSSLFAYGTNEYGRNRCNSHGECKCLCETVASVDGVCDQSGHNGYNLYKYADSVSPEPEPEPEPQFGNFHYFVKWDDKVVGGRFFESNLLEPYAVWKKEFRVKAHDGDEATDSRQVIFKIDCKPKKGNDVIAYLNNRAYAYLGKADRYANGKWYVIFRNGEEKWIDARKVYRKVPILLLKGLGCKESPFGHLLP